jgi:Zn-dependent protease
MSRLSPVIEFFLVMLPLLVAVVAHEVAHGYVAFRLGDPTAKAAGRLSLNPIRHLDPFGSLILPLILKFSGAPFLFGYAKPVPVNFANLRNRRTGTLWVASAGVITNFFLAAVSGLAFQGLVLLGSMGPAAHPGPALLLLLKLLAYSVMINLVLAVFNLIPIPPLDGGRILAALLPPGLQEKFHRVEPFGILLLILLLVTNSLDLLMTYFITPLTNWLLNL